MLMRIGWPVLDQPLSHADMPILSNNSLGTGVDRISIQLADTMGCECLLLDIKFERSA